MRRTHKLSPFIDTAEHRLHELHVSLKSIYIYIYIYIYISDKKKNSYAAYQIFRSNIPIVFINAEIFQYP